MSQAFFLLSELQVVVGPVLAAVEAGTLAKPGPWRPPEWRGGAALYSVTVPADQSTGQPEQVMVFDAILRAENNRELRKTEQPIQTSASAPVSSITDHIFQMPARVTLDILMSDAVQSYRPDNWTSAQSKSVSAYAALVKLLENGTLVTLTTRLDTYQNMVVESIQPTESARTLHGLRATVVFGKVFLADATAVNSRLIVTPSDDSSSQVSTQPQITGSTPRGTVQPTPVSTTTQTQNAVTPATLASFKLQPVIPGAGAWSSVTVGRLGGLIG